MRTQLLPFRLMLAVVAGLFISNASSAGTLVDFLPEPASPLFPEFIWGGSELFEGPGAIGTGFGLSAVPGDGELPTALQSLPGLLVETPLLVPGVLGSEVNGVSGATTFFDTTLDIIPTSGAVGLPASGPADILFGTIVQPLGSGAFKLWSTDPINGGTEVDDPILLLEGTIDSAVIAGLLGSTTGSALSASVTYTGGKIYDALLLAHPFTGPVPGEFSWSFLDIVSPLSIAGGTGFIAPFQSNGVGQFNFIPEPGTLALIAIGSGLVLYPRRRRHSRNR